MKPGPPIHAEEITALVLAGGRGSRMGGVDKGLQLFNGVPLALHTLMRLSPQVGSVMLNANRNLASYEAFGAQVLPDSTEPGDFAGPLAGFMAGLAHCKTSYLLTVPCDTPLFPTDLALRLAQACAAEGADLAIAVAVEEDGQLRPQPVFCLMHTSVIESLKQFLNEGGRKVSAWTAKHTSALVRFNLASDDPQAFVNANTLAELHRLETRQP